MNTQTSPSNASLWSALFRIASLVALCWAVYGQTLGFGYVPFDDHEIYDNPLLTSGLSLEHVRYFFSHYAGPNWFPLNWLSHMAVIELFGPKAWGEHLANVLLHTGNTLLLYLFLRRATGSAWRSWLVAGLFAAHPLHAESVAWISERKDVLSGFFFMLVLLAYERYVRRRGLLHYLSVFALLLLGLMAKSMLVTLPCVLLLADFWPFARLRKPGDVPRLLVEKLPFFALSLLFSLVAYYGAERSGTIGQGADTQILYNAANAFASYAVYLKRLFLPVGLAFFYPHPGTAFPLWKGGLALAGIAALTLLFWRQRRKRPYALMGWCWFLGMLVPVIGIVQPGLQGMADRYAYLPFIGLYIALVWLVADLGKIRHSGALWKIGAACTLLVLLSARAWDQARTWRSAEALAVSALANTRGNYVAHMLLMGVRGKQGLTEAAKKQYELASAINPYYVSLYHNRHALQCLTKGEYGKALEHYQRAHAIQPTAISAYNLGTILERLGRREDAREMLRNAIEQDPGLQPARKALERFFPTQIRATRQFVSVPGTFSAGSQRQGHGSVGRQQSPRSSARS